MGQPPSAVRGALSREELVLLFGGKRFIGGSAKRLVIRSHHEAEMEDYGSKDFWGVGGWLLFLCLAMVFFNPVTTLHEVFTRTLPLLSKTHDTRREILWSTYLVLFPGVSAFGVVAGIRLWLVRAGAVRLARLWLLTLVCAHVSYFFLWLALFRSARTSSLADMGWRHVAGPLFTFLFWNAYLYKSKRVRATFGEASFESG